MKTLNSKHPQYIMSQVFAAINHRLSEEYEKIELPSQEAKDRYVLYSQSNNLADLNLF